MNVMKGLVGVLAWALIAFGVSYVGFGIFNDLNWGAPWACPGPFFPSDYTVLDCIGPNTILVEIPLGLGILAAGIILLLVDKMVLQKK
jgi:hypothetical protein